MTAAVRRRHGTAGMTLIELCVVVAIMGVLFVMGIASLKRARLAANEASAIGSLRTITKGQFAYAVGCGRGSYATSLVILGTKPGGVTQGYLAEDLGSAVTVIRDGYRIGMGNGKDGVLNLNDCMGNRTETAYYAFAVPTASDVGRRAFATNQGGGIWERLGEVPPSEPFGPPAEPAH